jgi:hypothetical protein
MRGIRVKFLSGAGPTTPAPGDTPPPPLAIPHPCPWRYPTHAPDDTPALSSSLLVFLIFLSFFF